MRIQQTGDTKRGAFTLVDLLVTIGIIAILASISVWGVLSLMRAGPRVLNQQDISQLTISVDSFRSHFKNVKPFPSKMKLCNKYSSYDMTQQLDKDSLSYLGSLWPNLQWKDPSTGADLNIDWTGGLATSDYRVILEGDQCLVFFLGGIPGINPNGCFGFSTNPKNPTQLAGGRVGPFFTFASNRLYQRVSGMPFFSYRDAYGDSMRGQPYAYFSSNKKKNGYNSVAPSDCVSLGVNPYFLRSSPIVQFYNEDTFQIISAGENGKFGPGGLWISTQAGNIGLDGADDQTNFYSDQLGVAN